MSNRNATASWSGYSHQGQVGILIALRKLQESGIDLNTHYVQFETHEDVAIYRQPAGAAPIYLTVHQVKAYYSEGNTNKSKYSEVLNGHFESGNERFLHTAVEIIDWDTSDTTNNNGVLRYPYSTTMNYCGTTEIEILIKRELSNILNSVPARVDDAYYRLSFALDHKIRIEHQKAMKSLFDIKFSLQEIYHLIHSLETFNSKEIYDCRKLFYETYIEIVRNEDLDQSRIDFIQENILKQINALDDNNFKLLLQRMNLNRTPEQLQQSQIHYNHDGLKQVFFRMIVDIVNTNPSLIENSVKYNNTSVPGEFVLTAIIDEERDKLSVVKNIISNLKSQNLLWENHSIVNKDIEIDLVTRDPAINQIPALEEQEEGKFKFMNFSNSKLINKESARQKLN